MTDEGGCAYPLHGIDGVIDYGMSLRDYFAGQALVSVIIKCVPQERMEGESFEQMFARKSYLVADAMIAARSPHVSAQENE